MNKYYIDLAEMDDEEKDEYMVKAVYGRDCAYKITKEDVDEEPPG